MSEIKNQLYQAFSVSCFPEKINKLESLKSEIDEIKCDKVRLNYALESYKKDWLLRYIYNSNAIEGSTLSLQGTKLVLEGEFPPHEEQSQLKDVFAVIGVKQGYKFALDALKKDRNIDVDLIKDIHLHTAYDLQPATRGMIRNWAVYILGSDTVPVPYDRIRESLDDLIYFYNNSKQHPIIKAAALHTMFERIHPFGDGNGRAGRTLLNYSLLKDGYNDITIKFDHKSKYCNALEQWQVQGSPNNFIKLVIDSEITELNQLKSIKEEHRIEHKIYKAISTNKDDRNAIAAATPNEDRADSPAHVAEKSDMEK